MRSRRGRPRPRRGSPKAGLRTSRRNGAARHAKRCSKRSVPGGRWAGSPSRRRSPPSSSSCALIVPPMSRERPGAPTAEPSRSSSRLHRKVPELEGRVAEAFEARVREHEEQSLSPLAVRSYESRGRELDEEPCAVRTPFQRDRDRVVHTKSFRRLMHKTQVFIDPAGDHYRTRLTHTIEVTQIARTIGRALRLNEDVIEAIGLEHDMSHTQLG